MTAPTDTPALDSARTIGNEDKDLVVGIVAAMARETGDKFERILKLLEPVPRIEAAVGEVTKRVHAVEREVYLLAARVDGHDLQFTTLKAKKKPRARKPRSRKPRSRKPRTRKRR